MSGTRRSPAGGQVRPARLTLQGGGGLDLSEDESRRLRDHLWRKVGSAPGSLTLVIKLREASRGLAQAPLDADETELAQQLLGEIRSPLRAT